jgi:hypothetical protein
MEERELSLNRQIATKQDLMPLLKPVHIFLNICPLKVKILK